jgi:hypothetical protein
MSGCGLYARHPNFCMPSGIFWRGLAPREFPRTPLSGSSVNRGNIRGAIGLMRCTPEHPTLVLYAAPTGTDTKALPALPTTISDSRNSFAVTGCVCGNRNSFDSAQSATLSLLTLTEAKPPMSFREFHMPETGFPRTRLIGNSMNRGNPPLT